MSVKYGSFGELTVIGKVYKIKLYKRGELQRLATTKNKPLNSREFNKINFDENSALVWCRVFFNFSYSFKCRVATI